MSETLTHEAIEAAPAEHPADELAREQQDQQTKAREGVRRLALREVVLGEAPEVATLRDALQRAAWAPDDYRRVLDGLAALDGAGSVLNTDGAEVREYLNARSAFDAETAAERALVEEYSVRVREAKSRFSRTHPAFSAKISVQRRLASALGLNLDDEFAVFDRAQREVSSMKSEALTARVAAARANRSDREASIARSAQAHAAMASRELRAAEADRDAGRRVVNDEESEPNQVAHARRQVEGAESRIGEQREALRQAEADQRDAPKAAKRERREAGRRLKDAEAEYSRAIDAAANASAVIDAKLREALREPS